MPRATFFARLCLPCPPLLVQMLQKTDPSCVVIQNLVVTIALGVTRVNGLRTASQRFRETAHAIHTWLYKNKANTVLGKPFDLSGFSFQPCLGLGSQDKASHVCLHAPVLCWVPRGRSTTD